MVLPVDLFDDEIREDVGVVVGSVAEAGLRVELGDLVRSVLYLARGQAERSRDLVPLVVQEILEVLADEQVRERVLFATSPQLEEDALP